MPLPYWEVARFEVKFYRKSGEGEMYRSAIAQAMKFTFPVILTFRTTTGLCRSSIGTWFLINDEGYFATAFHIVKQIDDMQKALQASQAQAAAQTNRHQRRAHKSSPNVVIDRVSALWGWQGLLPEPSFRVLPTIDLAIGRLVGFDPEKHGNSFPEFKDPTKGFDAGASLCRLGFPFYDVNPKWDDASNGFVLQNVPLPIFPNEGILSRMAEQYLVDDKTGEPLPAPDFPLIQIETSNAGIRGQSGGPIFDPAGAIWGLQTATRSYPMDFSTAVAQYYHVGVGVSAATIIGALKMHNIKHKLSAH